MKTENVKKMLDSFYEAGRVLDYLPPLPEGVNISYIHILDSIYTLSLKNEFVRVSDVSKNRNLPLSGITRTVKEMEKKGYIKKLISSDDARVVNLFLTEKGKELYTIFVEIHQKELSKILKEVSEEKLLITIETIYKVSEIVKNQRINSKNKN
ncbi:MarR family winged helix-turn-helix transcriptional regulator [Fusobacterium vincentii]|uniref:MarR family winged helix-turn-helix transcriptional regulator n=1 Tax=Fusobacterium vincentii TaxID=155615 RepID=UPI003255805D